jgi:glycosyltransferase involved in cell wall biosynthesis
LFRHELIFMKGQSRASTLLVCNKESAREASKKWSSKLELFPVSGIAEEDLVPLEPEPCNGQFNVLTAGSLIRVKGFGLSIKGFQEFAKQHPEAHLSIVGGGPEESRLRSIADKSGVSDQIHFLGALPREKLLKLMGSSNVFLFPSLRDGGGTVVIEAMGLGKPVICLDTGGPGMHITNECGVKIAPESPEQAAREIAEALEDLCQNEDRRLELGQAARKRAEDLYLWNKLGDRLTHIYDQAIQQNGAAKTD